MPDLLRDLAALHGTLRLKGLLPDAAFCMQSIGGATLLDAEGRFAGVEIKRERRMVPTPPTRSNNIAAAFLTGQPPYWTAGKGKRAAAALEATRVLHRKILEDVKHSAAGAILSYLDAPAPAAALPEINGTWMIQVDGMPAHETPEIADAWRRHYRPDPGRNTTPLTVGQPFLRMVSANFPATQSYGQRGAQVPPAIDQAAWVAALNWLILRPGNVRIGEAHYLAWIDDDPEADMMPWIVPFAERGDEVPEWQGTLHLACLTARPPARISVAAYHVLPAPVAADRLRVWHRKLVAARRWDWRATVPAVTPWPMALTASERQAPLVTSTISAVMEGRTLPQPLLREIIMLNRRKIDNLDARASLLSIYLGMDVAA